MTPSSILMRLIKAIGPINTYYIHPVTIYTNRGIRKSECRTAYSAAYSQAKVALQTKTALPKNKNCLPKSKLVNAIITPIITIEESGLNEAVATAHKQGRIRCNFIGQPGTEKVAIDFIIRIAANVIYRTIHRKAISHAVKSLRKYWNEKKAGWPDPHQPDTLGWRVWHWDGKLLVSPSQRTVWHTAELRVDDWNSNIVVRGQAGIHAARMPYNWQKAKLDGTELAGFDNPYATVIIGIVERFGRYVLGTEGWRAEWVIIRKLKAPSTEIGLALEQAYPEVEVVYANR